MSKSWNDATTEQDAIARKGLAAAHDHFLGLYKSLLNVYAELDKTWFFTSDVITKLEEEIESLRDVPTPIPLEMYGRWDEIAPPPVRTTDSATEKVLRSAADARDHYIQVLALQANVWQKVTDTYTEGASRISDKAKRMIATAPNDFIVKIVEVETGVVKLTGVDLMISLIPAIGERAAQAQAIHDSLTSTIEKLKLDVVKFREGIELKEYKNPTTGQLPRFNWENPSDITQKRGEAVAEIQGQMVDQTTLTFEQAARLVEEANDIARYNARLARWALIARLIGGIANLSMAIAKAGDGPRPPNARVGNMDIKVPAKGYYMEWYWRYQQGDRGYFDAGSRQVDHLPL